MYGSHLLISLVSPNIKRLTVNHHFVQLFVSSMMTERYSNSDFYNAASYWHYDNTALLLWHPTSIGSRELFRISGPCTCYH